jgi:hypothetical protein
MSSIIKNLINFDLRNSKFSFVFGASKKQIFNKGNTKILFIDDETFPIVKNLYTQAGWNASSIRDLKNLQDPIVVSAQIIFVDYEGVGKILYPTEKGLGIVKALKETYGDSKRVILYSAHNTFGVNAEFEIADGRIPKNSDLYEFIKVIETEVLKLNGKN